MNMPPPNGEQPNRNIPYPQKIPDQGYNGPPDGRKPPPWEPGNRSIGQPQSKHSENLKPFKPPLLDEKTTSVQDWVRTMKDWIMFNNYSGTYAAGTVWNMVMPSDQAKIRNFFEVKNRIEFTPYTMDWNQLLETIKTILWACKPNEDAAEKMLSEKPQRDNENLIDFLDRRTDEIRRFMPHSGLEKQNGCMIQGLKDLNLKRSLTTSLSGNWKDLTALREFITNHSHNLSKWCQPTHQSSGFQQRSNFQQQNRRQPTWEDARNIVKTYHQNQSNNKPPDSNFRNNYQQNPKVGQQFNNRQNPKDQQNKNKPIIKANAADQENGQDAEVKPGNSTSNALLAQMDTFAAEIEKTEDNISETESQSSQH